MLSQAVILRAAAEIINADKNALNVISVVSGLAATNRQYLDRGNCIVHRLQVNKHIHYVTELRDYGAEI